MAAKNEDDWRRQGKQVADAFVEGVEEIRDGITEQTAKHEDTIKGKLGRVTSYLDQKTGGKYTDQLGKANSRLADSVGKVADQGRASAERRERRPNDDDTTG